MTDDPTPVDDDLKEAENLSRRPTHPPAQVSGYEFQKFLGRGAFGEVWLAEDRNTGRRVAIKFYNHRGGLDWSLLSREVEKLRFLFGDRHVVQLITVGWDANPPYYIMEHLEQGSLEDLLEKGALPVDRALEVFRDVAEGLRHAHGKGILHCDLKPANVLLDQDMRPRLADFGQARLTHEHSAALGTVYYMAPEQADMNAAPDARWDVYALGALMYRMLTGEAPHRSEALRQDLTEATTLKERLVRYRQLIYKAPQPSAHRKVQGVDRGLAEIIDRCLAKRAEKRFPTVDAVLAALQARALRRARRPLLVLGVAGPILLLALVAFFAWRAFTDAVEGSKESLTEYTLQSDRLTAEHVNRTVGQAIHRRWKILERVALDQKLHKGLKEVGGQPHNSPNRALLDRLDQLFKDYEYTGTSSAWFLIDMRGMLPAISPKDRRDRVKEKGLLNPDQTFKHRDYFHGQGHDLDPKVGNVEPIKGPYLSTVLESKLDNPPLRIVVFSVPVRDGRGETLGVLCMSVNLGRFHELGSSNGQQATGQNETRNDRTGGFAVLVDTGEDWNHERGLILQHPQLEEMRAKAKPLPPAHVGKDDLSKLKDLVDQPTEKALFLTEYEDPYGKDYKAYAGRWLVVARPVRFKYKSQDTGAKEKDVRTPWVVLVQENYADVIEPVGELQATLIRDGLLALTLTVVLMAGLWAFVILVLNDSARNRMSAFLRRRAGLPSGLSTHSGSLSTRSGSMSGGILKSDGTASGDVRTTRHEDDAKEG
jgi:serine/threonine protein kinase